MFTTKENVSRITKHLISRVDHDMRRKDLNKRELQKSINNIAMDILDEVNIACGLAINSDKFCDYVQKTLEKQKNTGLCKK